MVRNLIAWLREERGQDVFEYVLIIGIITVAVLVAVATPIGENLIEAIVDATCAAIEAVGNQAFADAIDCAAINPPPAP